MTSEQIARTYKAIAECDAYIAREEARRSDIRSEAVAEYLAFCKKHMAALIVKLETEGAV